MQKIIEYIVVRDDSLYKGELIDGFQDLINKKIQEGYQPLGGISAGYGFCQAMVKYEEQNDAKLSPDS